MILDKPGDRGAGTITVKQPVLVLAPMAEITHSAFRHLTEGFGGCDLYYTEMLSVGALLNVSPYEKFYTDLLPLPSKTIIQFVGEEPEYFHRAAVKMAGTGAAGFDINMGCSIGTIRNKGWGIELMSQPEKVREILRGVRSAAPDKSLSVKLRLGIMEDEKSLFNFCELLLEEGVDFISLNPKTGREGRNRTGRWEWVSLLQKRLPIPVFGNSDITGWESYRRKVETATPAGVMIGRGAAACPWIFALIKGREKSTDFKMEINLKETAEDFFRLLKKYQPDDFHLSRSRRFFFYYCENLKFSHRTRYDIQNSSSLNCVEDLIFSYFERNPEEVCRIF
ncbi:MAG: tRNA-dihydrouridine synthase family protein [Spirochaetales bacterium]|nr:tRNA-dihydrouridine synthase family protein [Spirochaetales bacterium]